MQDSFERRIREMAADRLHDACVFARPATTEGAGLTAAAAAAPQATLLLACCEALRDCMRDWPGSSQEPSNDAIARRLSSVRSLATCLERGRAANGPLRQTAEDSLLLVLAEALLVVAEQWGGGARGAEKVEKKEKEKKERATSYKESPSPSSHVHQESAGDSSRTLRSLQQPRYLAPSHSSRSRFSLPVPPPSSSSSSSVDAKHTTVVLDDEDSDPPPENVADSDEDQSAIASSALRVLFAASPTRRGGGSATAEVKQEIGDDVMMISSVNYGPSTADAGSGFGSGSADAASFSPTYYPSPSAMPLPLPSGQSEFTSDGQRKQFKYQCSICGLGCTSRTQLESHINVHTGRRPFACSICEKSYKRRDHLSDHMKKTHPAEYENIRRKKRTAGL